jgi:hypothetical protein
MPFHKNARQNHDMDISYVPVENVADFRYLLTTTVYKNCFEEETGSGEVISLLYVLKKKI